MAIENYFRDPSSTSVKCNIVNDVVIYGGLNTGVKFPVYLGYFVLPSEKRPINSPPYYELLMKQITPFPDKLDVEHHVETPTIAFAQEARASELPPPISDDESSEKAADFLTRTSDACRHSAPNARALMDFAYLGAYDIKSQQEFSVVYGQITGTSNSSIAHIKNVVEQEKPLASRASGIGKHRKIPAIRAKKTLQGKDDIPLIRRRTKLKEVTNIHSAGDPKAA